MLKAERISLETAGVLNPLVQDYLNALPALREFYSYTPDLSGFSKAILEAPYQSLKRETLVQVLKTQHNAVRNGSQASEHNIAKLALANTFTITTGHQLCLFTGPLYFLYKIFSVINLAERLNKQFPDHNFVPLYWMAGEDHDFAEINHFNVYGKTLQWESDQGGSVGDFSTVGLDKLFERFSEILGSGPQAEELLILFREAYLSHQNLKDATRHLVNALFGAHGLVVLDANDPALKASFKTQILNDLEQHTAFEKVNESNNRLIQANYHLQVKPRQINLFYSTSGSRLRLEKENGNYKLVGTDKSFTAEQIKTELNTHPERFSPNVVLRPLYQQMILPNLAYVGGPGELAYWLQYKAFFESQSCFYPVLVPRSFVTILDKPSVDRIQKLGFSPEELFLEEKVLVDRLLARSGDMPSFEEDYTALQNIYDKLSRKLASVDKSLEASAKAELQKSLSGLKTLEAKLTRAFKQRSDTEIKQISNVRQKLFPNNEPQERVENFSAFYLRYGKAFFEALKRELDPLDQREIILLETES